jgi:hypothetical protein
VGIMDGMMLIYSLLKFIDMPLLTMYVAVCIQMSSIEAFNPEELSTCFVC